MNDVVTGLSYIGFGFLAYCTVVGAYMTLRWGAVGVLAILSKKSELDDLVNQEVSSILRGRK